MRLIFVHDNRFTPIEGRVYSEAQFPSSVWRRYIGTADELVVVGRLGVLPDGRGVDGMTLSSAPNVSFEFLPNLSGLGAQALLRSAARKRMRALLNGSDGVIARLPSELGLLAIAEAIRLKKPWAVEVVGCAWDAIWNYGSIKGKLYAPIAFWRMRRAVKRSAYALYVTRDFLQSRYPSLAQVTTSCSNVDIARPQAEVLVARKRSISQSKPTFVLGVIGSLRTKYKGIQTILPALAQVRSTIPNLELRVLGDGDIAPWVALARAHGVGAVTHFDGVKENREAVLRWLDEVDLYLQPSLQEGLPRSLIEAMSRGCPAIGSTAAGIPELLDKAAMIAPGDVTHLAEMITNAYRSEEWRTVQAERNWMVAQSYCREVLDERRATFWDTFKSHVGQTASHFSEMSPVETALSISVPESNP